MGPKSASSPAGPSPSDQFLFREIFVGRAKAGLKPAVPARPAGGWLRGRRVWIISITSPRVGSARLLINHRARPDVIYGRHRRHVISLTMDRQQSDSDTETSAKLCAESWNPIHLRFTDSRGISLAATRDHLHSPGSRQRSKPLTGFLCNAGQNNPATQCR